MPAQFRNYQFILVDDVDTTFRDKTFAALDILRGLAQGTEFLDDMNGCSHRVLINPPKPGKGNMCVSVKPGRFVTLRQAFMAVGEKKISTELTNTLAKAAQAGVSREFLARQLCAGMSPVTVHTAENIVAPHSSDYAKARFKSTSFFSSNSEKARQERALKMINDYADGTIKYFANPVKEGERRITDDLMRLLKPWCDPGVGAPATLFFNPDKEWSCDQDIDNTRRPAAIGLIHELCHAWRNVKGLRFFDDAQACGLNDDEVMTTGFPPYGNERFTENLFRAQWPADQGKLDIRTDYRTYGFEQWQRDQAKK